MCVCGGGGGGAFHRPLFQALKLSRIKKKNIFKIIFLAFHRPLFQAL